MANFNTARLAEDIKREISTAMRDIKDSTVAKAMVGVSRCELTSDLSFCKVYITTLDGGETTKTAAEHLKKAEGFFKRRINERVKMRKLPQLIFVADNSMDYYEHISEVISKLPKPADENDGGDSEREDE
ncbi:MAG: 30S ribosome-binding factor RbfA [Ruminiclostridium sp.]|nr:30S ribosome-binding factor RbfA [Ruminiclostridium sp.]